jgi:NAD(P)-dependent dehydrogenase (short-subunit alcohol dehydrogenase family)
MSGSLSGKRALITGASSGIGLATAKLFAEQGAAVFGLDRSWSTSIEGVEPVEGDVTSSADVTAAVEQAAGEEGLDILVANAGIGYLEDWLTADLDTWAAVIDVNLFGVMRCFQAAAANMIRHERKGRLLVTTSVAGLRAWTDTPSYCASKAGVISLVKSAALTFAANEITVNAVAPGNIDTPAQIRVMQESATMQQRTLEDLFAEQMAVTPLRRLGRPEEIAATFLFLASDAAAYLTGETICVDGGMMLL